MGIDAHSGISVRPSECERRKTEGLSRNAAKQPAAWKSFELRGRSRRQRATLCARAVASVRATHCGIFTTISLYFRAAKLLDHFSALMSPGRNNGGRQMENTAVVTLLLLMFGQFLILTCGALLLWFMGDFGEKPKWFNRRKEQAQEPVVVMPKRPSERAGKADDSLLSLANDHSIQPRVMEERSEKEERVERAPERSEKTAEVPARGFVT
jgi:hypothetical protein